MSQKIDLRHPLSILFILDSGIKLDGISAINSKLYASGISCVGCEIVYGIGNVLTDCHVTDGGIV